MGIKKPEDKKPDDEGGEDQPKYLTAEDLDTILDAKLNKSITGHLKRFGDGLEKKLEALKPAARETEPEPKAGEKEPEWKAELARERKEREKLQKKLDESEKTANEERTKLQRSEERTALAAALRKQGVDELRLKPALAFLYTEEQRVGRTSEGHIVFRTKKNGEIEEGDLEEGVAAWAKSEEGKGFLPSRDAGGTGSGRIAGRQNGAGAKDDKVAAAKNVLFDAVMGGE